jgi:hypothetical protein
MYKSTMVKLVFLNSVLAFSACARTCEPEEIKKDGQFAEKDQQPRRSCHGTGHRGGGSHFIYVPGGGGSRSGGGGGGQTGSGSVGRGGFGATGSGAAS